MRTGIYLIAAIAFGAFASRNVHVVNVGIGGSFRYEPNSISADVGDIVSFRFFPTNHSVVRGVYAGSGACGQKGCNPCIPYETIYSGGMGFDSGNVPTQTAPTDVNVSLRF
jgi:plastocyanin